MQYRDFQNKEYMDLHRCRVIVGGGVFCNDWTADENGSVIHSSERRVGHSEEKVEDQDRMVWEAAQSGLVYIYRTRNGGAGFVSEDEAKRLLEAGVVRFEFF